MISAKITFEHWAYIFLALSCTKRPSAPWGAAPAPGEVQKWWRQLVSWQSRSDLTPADLTEMLSDAGAPECRPEQVTGLCGVLGNHMSARERSAAFLKEKHKHKREREPSERIAAACAELRRAIPKEIEWLEHDMTGLPEVSTYEQEISGLSSLLDATNIKHRPPRFVDEEVDLRKYDASAVRLIFFSYELIFGQSGISRGSPAVRFIVAAIKRIGWDPVSPGAVEQLLRRSLDRRVRVLFNTN